MENKKEILPAVAAVIFNDRGEVLLQKRRDVDKWCLISGHVEFGETVENAILREVAEEINVPAKIVRFIGVYSSPVSQTYYYPERTVQYITSYFELQLTGQVTPEFSNHETKEIGFFSPGNIPADLAQLNAHWLTDALDRDAAVFIR